MTIFKNIYHFVVDKKIPTLSGSLAFFVILNGGAFLFLYVALAGALPGSYEQFLLQQVEEGPFKDFLTYLLDYQLNLSYSIFLIGTSLYSASSLYYHLMHIAEIVSGNALKLNISKRIIALFFTILFLVCIHAITFCAAYLMLRFQSLYLPVLLLSILVILILVIYAVNMSALKTFKAKKLYKGVLFTFIYGVLFTLGFALYLKLFSNFKVIYGIFSFFIILMFYLYVLCIGFVLGIYINCKNLDVFKLLKSKQ